jgi:hypothetical protein
MVREKIELTYDVGAVNGASHWDTIHGYYVELARAKGCKKGAPYANGPVKACHKVSRPEPKLLGAPYNKGRNEIVALSLESLYPELVRKVLFVGTTTTFVGPSPITNLALRERTTQHTSLSAPVPPRHGPRAF